jgi:hypothetical protein
VEDTSVPAFGVLKAAPSKWAENATGAFFHLLNAKSETPGQKTPGQKRRSKTPSR